MKIGVFSRSLPVHGGGGMERIAWDLMCEWVKMGHEVFCYTTPFSNKIIDQSDYAQPSVFQLSGLPGRYSKEWFSETVKIANSENFDVIMGVSAGAHAIVESGYSKCPVVMQAHGTSKDEICTKLQIKTVRSIAGILKNLKGMFRDFGVYSKYNAVVAIGPSVVKSLKSYPKRFQPKHVQLIENGVHARPFPTAEEKKVAKLKFGLIDSIDFDSGLVDQCVLFVGRLHHEKGVDLVIENMEHWNGKLLNGKLLIVGEGPAKTSLQSLVSSKDLQERVVFTGQLDQKGVHEAMVASDLLVVPSRRREGLPMVVLEGLAHGLPVIMSDHNLACFGDHVPDGIYPAKFNNKDLSEAACGHGSPGVLLEKKYFIEETSNLYVHIFKECKFI